MLNNILQIGQKKFLLLVKSKIKFLGLVVSDLIREDIAGSFYEKELQKINQEKFRIDKALKRKGDKLYVKWKEYYKSFNIWTDKGDFI